MRVLVTGGMGYLGSVVVKKLLQKGFKVKVFDSLLYLRRFSDADFELVHADIRDMKSLTKALTGVDTVIHLAGIVGDAAGDLNKELTIDVNYAATRNLSELCNKRGLRLIFASTCSVYGSKANELLDEGSETLPLSIYAITKLAAEEFIKKTLDDFVIFRLGTLFGLSPRMRFDLVVNRFVAQAIQDKRITVFGGYQFRPFLHVEDAADAFVKATESNKTGLYNLGGINYRIADVAKIIKEKTGCELSFFEDIMDLRNYKVDSELAKRNFGVKFTKDIRTATDEITDAYAKGIIKDYKEPIYSNEEWLRGLLK